MDSAEDNPISSISHAVESDVGRVRLENQDAYGCFVADDRRIYIVADGMGGAKAGATAAQLAVDIVGKELLSAAVIDEPTISAAVSRANAVIYDEGSRDPNKEGMGTTIVGLCCFGTSAYVINVGDSRIYRLRDGYLEHLTEDHTVVGELVKAGAISQSQAINLPVSHMLTRSLGPSPAVEVDCFRLADGPASSDIYLLCSDGLYNRLGGSDLAQLMVLPAHQAAESLIQRANEMGGQDNITALLVRFGESFPVPVDSFPEWHAAVKAMRARDETDPKHESSEPVSEPEIPGDKTATEKEASQTPKLDKRRKLVLGAALGISGACALLVVGVALFGSRQKPETEISPLSKDFSVPWASEQGAQKGARSEGVPLVQDTATIEMSELDQKEAKAVALEREVDAINRRLQYVRGLANPDVKGKLDEIAKLHRETDDALRSLDQRIQDSMESLAQLQGAQRALEESDPAGVAPQLASEFQEVRTRKLEYDQASWALIDAADKGRKDLSELVAARNQARTALREALKAAVSSRSDELEQEIRSLTARRGDVEAERDQYTGDSVVLNDLAGADDKRRAAMEDDLANQITTLRTERQALNAQ